MENENQELEPRKNSLFALQADDIVENALQNLDESQTKRVTEKAADEMVRLAVEKRKAQYRNDAAQYEMQNLIDNANLLDKSVGEYKINSTFETASGTTNVEIKKENSQRTYIIIGVIGVLAVLVFLIFIFGRG